MTKIYKLSLITTALVAIVAMFAYGAIRAQAAAALLGGASFGVGHVVLVSDTITPSSGISFDDANGKAFSKLSTLSTDFDVTDDDCLAGSPRFEIDVDATGDLVADGTVLALLGPSPTFTGCTPGYQSSGNLIGNNDAGRWDFTGFGGAVGGYNAAPASVLNGKITDIRIVVDDGASFGDLEQTVLIDNISIILSSTYDFEPVTLVVDDDLVQCLAAAYSTIQDAVNAASSGDTVQVCAGTYAENVTINKSLTLSGANAGTTGTSTSRVAESIIDGGGLNSVIKVEADDVTIDGFTLQGGAGTYNTGVMSANVDSNSGLTVKNNIITDNSIGVYPECTDCLIENNLFDSNNRPGPAGGSGIYTEHSTNLTIRNNEFKGHLNNSAIILTATAAGAHQNVSVLNNYIHDNNNDNSMVYVSGVTGGTFTGNTINLTGLRGFKFAGANSGFTVTNNTLTNAQRGILFADDVPALGANESFTVTNNNLAGNSVAGIEISGGYTGTLNATCNWWGDASGPGPVGPGTGSEVSADVTFTPWLTTSDLEGPCNGPLLDVTVTIVKYIDGVHANAASADSLAFPMDVSWDADNIGAGSGSFGLTTTGFNNPNEYEATTADMTNGADYSLEEDLTGPNVGTSCAAGVPYSLFGYTVGSTELEAASSTPILTPPALTGITTDQFIIVWNLTCEATLTLEKVVVNDDTGSEVATAWTLTATGPTVISGVDGDPSVTSAIVYPGTYDLSEAGPAGYAASDWVCVGGGNQIDGDTIEVGTGENITCTITNNDDAAPPVPAPSATACATPSSAPIGYTLQNGTTGNDVVSIAPFTMFVGKGGNDSVSGLAPGNYIVCTGTGNDVITLGNGNFTIGAGNGINSITTGNGDGYIASGPAGDSITTGDGVQTIEAGGGNNVIETGDGDKTITTLTANDRITTGDGNDIISAGGGINNVNSGAGNDTVTTGTSSDTIDGGADFDTCNAGSGINSVSNCEA